MQSHRNDGARPMSRRETLPSPGGKVHALGPASALQIEFEAAQLPWLAHELDTVRHCVQDELDHERARAARFDGTDAVGARKIARLERQVEALNLMRAQVPIDPEAVPTAVASPWTRVEPEARHVLEAEPVFVAGPAALMTVVIRGAARHVAHQLAEVLQSGQLDVDERTYSCAGWAAGELPVVSPSVAAALRRMARAARAFTETYMDVLSQQSFALDTAIGSSEEVSVG